MRVGRKNGTRQVSPEPPEGGRRPAAPERHPEEEALGRKALRHALLFALCLGLTLVVRTTLKDHYRQERRQIEAAGRARRTVELAAAWNQLPYTDLASPDFTLRFLNATNWQPLQLSAVQEARLRERLTEVLAYLARPTVAGYLRLKTNGLQPHFELSAPARRMLSGGSNTAPAADSLPTAELVARLWERISSTAAPPPARLTAVCLARLKVGSTRTNSSIGVFGGSTAQGLTVMQGALNPGFQYGPDRLQANVAEDDRFVLVSFFARSNTSTNAGPVYLSLWWSAADQQWVPHRLFTDALLHLNLFF